MPGMGFNLHLLRVGLRGKVSGDIVGDAFGLPWRHNL